MIKNDIFVSGDFYSFKQQIANHTLIWDLYAGKNSYLAMSLSAIDQHISDNLEAYREYIQNDPLFIVSFLHDIHFRLQRFFKSLVLASSVEDIKFEYVNFSDMLLKVDMRNYLVQSPTWYKQLTVKKDKDSSSQFRKGSDHHQLSDDNSRRKVPEINQNVDSACKLMDGERWGAIFHPKNTENASLPKVNNTDLCLKFHINGRCHSKCARKTTHVTLNNSNLIGLRSFVKLARENHAAFLSKRTERMNTNRNNSHEEASKPKASEDNSQGENKI